MNQLQIVSSVIMMHKQIMAARVITEEVAQIITTSGDVYYLHFAILGENPKFAIGNEQGELLTGFINGAEAVSFFVNKIAKQHLLTV